MLYLRISGRNGGHLTPVVFRNFQSYETGHGKDEALRAIALEHHTVSEIVKIIRENGKDEDLDLVQGDHMDLYITKEEEDTMEQDYTAAKEAGVDLSSVQIYSKEELEKVG